MLNLLVFASGLPQQPQPAHRHSRLDGANLVDANPDQLRRVYSGSGLGLLLALTFPDLSIVWMAHDSSDHYRDIYLAWTCQLWSGD